MVGHASDTGQCTNTCERAYIELVFTLTEEVAELLFLGYQNQLFYGVITVCARQIDFGCNGWTNWG